MKMATKNRAWNLQVFFRNAPSASTLFDRTPREEPPRTESARRAYPMPLFANFLVKFFF